MTLGSSVFTSPCLPTSSIGHPNPNTSIFPCNSSLSPVSSSSLQGSLLTSYILLMLRVTQLLGLKYKTKPYAGKLCCCIMYVLSSRVVRICKILNSLTQRSSEYLKHPEQ